MITTMFQNENEEWRQIPGYEGKYQVSSLGRLYSYSSDDFVKPEKNNKVSLYVDGKMKAWSIHVLMGCAFLGNDINDPYRNRVLFKDGNSSHLELDNLYVEDTSDLPGEEWRSINSAVGRPIKSFYQVSNMGRVKTIKHDTTWKNGSKISTKAVPEMILSQTTGERGYKTVWIAAQEKPDITAQVHRLIADAFCENDDPVNKVQVNHIDGNPSNNKASNLEWITPQLNTQHAIETGLKKSGKGRKLRYPVLHLETGKIYTCLSDVDRALGRSLGYCSEHLQYGRPITDKDGNLWTLQVFEGAYLKVNSDGRHCLIDEFPGREFVSLSEASEAIGRWEGYISECLQKKTVIKNKAGQAMHFHYVDPEQEAELQSEYYSKLSQGNSSAISRNKKLFNITA